MIDSEILAIIAIFASGLYLGLRIKDTLTKIRIYFAKRRMAKGE